MRKLFSKMTAWLLVTVTLLSLTAPAFAIDSDSLFDGTNESADWESGVVTQSLFGEDDQDGSPIFGGFADAEEEPGFTGPDSYSGGNSFTTSTDVGSSMWTMPDFGDDSGYFEDDSSGFFFDSSNIQSGDSDLFGDAAPESSSLFGAEEEGASLFGSEEGTDEEGFEPEISLFSSTAEGTTSSVKCGSVTVSLFWNDVSYVQGDVNYLGTDSSRNVSRGPTLAISPSLMLGQSIGAEDIRITIPSSVASGRISDDNGILAIPAVPSGWRLDENGSTVTLVNTKEITKATTINIELPYSFNPWTTASKQVFDVTCEVSCGSESRVIKTSGALVTMVGVSISSSTEETFFGVDRESVKLDRNSSTVSKAFDCGDLDFENYVYDIGTYTVTPSGSQKYDVSFITTPGKFPNWDTKPGYKFYGWDGEVVSAIAYPVSYSGAVQNVTYGDVMKLDPYKVSRLTPGSDNNDIGGHRPTNHAGGTWSALDNVPDASSWYTYYYRFTPRWDVWSGGEYTQYSISVLYRFPRNGSLTGAKNASDSSLKNNKIWLYESTIVSHIGVDDVNAVATAKRNERVLYNGLYDAAKYGGYIYASQFTEEKQEIAGGLNSIRNGRSVTASAESHFYVLNPNRDDYNPPIARGTNQEYDIWCTLDGVVLIVSDGSETNQRTLLLEKGDYTIDSISVGIRDADGDTGMYMADDGLPHFDLSWHEPNAAPAYSRDKTFSVLYGQDNSDLNYKHGTDVWKTVDGAEQLTVGDCWFTTSQGHYVSTPKRVDLRGLNATRVCVRYKESEYLNQINCEYTVTLNSGSPRVQEFLSSSDVTFVGMGLWTAMVAYDGNEVHNLHTGPDRIDTVGSSTGGLIREWELDLMGKTTAVSNYYWDYHSTIQGGQGTLQPDGTEKTVMGQYAYRKFHHITFTDSMDTAGYTWSRFIWDSNGLVGTTEWEDSAAGIVPATGSTFQDTGRGVQKVVYTVSSGLFDGSALHTNLTGYPELLREFAGEKRAGVTEESPYAFKGQKLYFLLPAGLKYNGRTGKIGYGQEPDIDLGARNFFGRQLKPTGYASNWVNIIRPTDWTLGDLADSLGEVNKVPNHNIYVEGMGYQYFKPINDEKWSTYFDLDVATEMVNGRQLLVLTIMQKSGLEVNYPLAMGTRWSNQTTDHFLQGLGTTVSFVMEVEEGESLPTNSYDLLMITEYLDADGNPYDLGSGFSGPIYSDLSQKFPSVDLSESSLLDQSSGRATFVAAQDNWTNYNGSNASNAFIRVNNTDSVDLEASDTDYTYSLSYFLGYGTATDVVLFSNLEGTSFKGIESEWRGTISSVDCNGTNAEIWVRDVPVNYEEYCDSTCSGPNMLLADGWRRVGNPGSSEEFMGVQAIAVYFKDTIFSAIEADKPDRAEIYLHMKTPSGTQFGGGSDRLTNYSQIMYSNYLDSGILQSSKGNEVIVTIPAAVDPLQSLLPETGGFGAAASISIGGVMVCGGMLFLMERKRRKAL